MKLFSVRTFSQVLTAVLVAASSIVLTAPAAHAATSGTVSPSSAIEPGTAMSYTLNDPDGTFCNTTNGTNVAIYVNFYNEDNEAVSYSYWEFTYATAGNSYNWTDTFYVAVPGGSDFASRNWTLTPRFTCWAVTDVTRNAPTVPAFDYTIVSVSDETPAPGDTVTAVVTDGDGAWCDNMNPIGAIVRLSDTNGDITTLPIGWAQGNPGLGSFNSATDETTVPFTIPSSFPGGNYTADVFCVEEETLNLQSPVSAQFDLRISATSDEDLAATGTPASTGIALLAALAGAMVFLVAAMRIRPQRN